jgi:hypothetical protein
MVNLKKILNNRIILPVLLISGPIFILTTNPHHLPLPLLMIPFLWVFAIIFFTILPFLSNRGVTNKKSVISAGIIGAVPVVLVVFQSISQLSVKDVVLAAVLILLASIYIYKADFIS